MRAALRAGLFALLLAPFPAAASGEDVAAYLWPSAELTHLLTPELARALDLRSAEEFAVGAGGRVVLLERGGAVLDLAGRRRLPLGDGGGAESLAVSSGLLLLVRGDRLGVYGGGGVADRVHLPLSGMKVAGGSGEDLYVYGTGPGGSAVYLLREQGAVQILSLPGQALGALAAVDDRLFVAVANRIYTVKPGERPGLVFLAAGGEPVSSLAVDRISGALYFSCGDTVYALRGGVALSILQGISGTLRYEAGALYVLDAGKARLVRVTGLERLLVGAERDGPSPAGHFLE